ncbi:MAG TPA: hypothetical protein VHG93_14835 [Longimicrobium sp.]|nr:hypothetical protein [Longimicrobium sp.]
MKHALRSLFAVLAAALAFAGAHAGHGSGEARGAGLRPADPRLERRAEKALAALPQAARLLLRGGDGRGLDGPRRASGAPPRLSAGTDPSRRTHFAARTLMRRASGARTRRTLTLRLARRMAAARDGTLSSRSNGVPPPPST